MENYRIAATDEEIIAFFEAEFLGSGWKRYGSTGMPGWRAYEKLSRLISVAPGKGGTFTIMGGTR